jgi:hypothetical protein
MLFTTGWMWNFCSQKFLWVPWVQPSEYSYNLPLKRSREGALPGQCILFFFSTGWNPSSPVVDDLDGSYSLFNEGFYFFFHYNHSLDICTQSVSTICITFI